MKKSVRLSKDIIPYRYTLELAPDLEAFTFTGKETIDIELAKLTKTITLHSRDINIETAEIIHGKTRLYAKKISYDKACETATFAFDTAVMKGKAKIVLAFQGVISDSLRGFYKSTYVLDGETKHLATTQFEATDARRAFPCFDEPAQKAVFDVSLIIPTTHTAISNTMPTSIREHSAGYKIVEFSSTPRMSTYLLAFIIGEFESVESGASLQTKVRVFTTKGKSHQAKFALEVAAKCLEFYNKYFDIPYPLPVLDMIAIPDFESAAMENWGAITFRESAILFDEASSSLANKQWVATVIAHEIAHQWFGNLVTMHWWTDLWLNEGFAEFIPIVCLDTIFPTWNMKEIHVADGRLAVAMRLDSLEHSHPIQVEVHHPDEIGEVFDMISYAKGAAVIRQLEEYLGADVFRDGLRHYLKKHSYKNTETQHLWESFEKVSGKAVARMMKSWTLKSGYPLVTLSRNKDSYFVEQERFFSSRISARKNQEKTLWEIPLSYQNGSDGIGKLNLGETSFIRVRYDKETLAKLKREIEKGRMATIDKLGIIRDLYALAEGGYIRTDELLDFSLAYITEKEYIVWAEIAAGMNKVYNILDDKEDQERYKKYILSLFSPLAKRMGWNPKKGEDPSYTFLRSLALGQAGAYGDKKVIAEAKALWKNKTKKPIRADIRSVVYTILAQNGSEKEWNEFKKLYDAEDMHEQKNRYAQALTSFRDKTLLAKTLMFTISSAVRDQDAPHLIASVWMNRYGRELAWQFARHNWPTLLKRYGEGGHFLGRLLSPLGLHKNTKDIVDAKKFFKKNAAPGAQRTLEQSYERIAGLAAWIKDDKKIIETWLKKNF